MNIGIVFAVRKPLRIDSHDVKWMIFSAPLYDAWHYSLFAETDIIRLANNLLNHLQLLR